MFDFDNSGSTSADELNKVVKSMLTVMEANDAGAADEMTASLSDKGEDVNQDGVVTKDEVISSSMFKEMDINSLEPWKH